MDVRRYEEYQPQQIAVSAWAVPVGVDKAVNSCYNVFTGTAFTGNLREEWKMAVYKYMRLSKEESVTEGNGFARQENNMKHIVEDRIFTDVISGAKRERPALNKMLSELEPGDIVYISSIDRLSRSSKDLIDITETIKDKGAYLVSVKDSWLDTRESNPMGQFLLTVMGAMAQLERDLITERVKEGMEAAKERGVKFGRPSGSSAAVTKAAKMYMRGGLSMRQVAKLTGVSIGSISKAVRKIEAERAAK